MIAGWRSEQDIFAEIWPTNLHGFIGPLGLILLFIMTRFGKQAKANRLAGESFAVEKINMEERQISLWHWFYSCIPRLFVHFLSFNLLLTQYHDAATCQSHSGKLCSVLVLVLQPQAFMCPPPFGSKRVAKRDKSYLF